MNLPLAPFVTIYLKQTPKAKKILQQVYHNQKVNKVSFIKGKSLCKRAKCSKDTRQRLKRRNAEEGNLMFDCQPRFEKNGRQTTDQYVLNSNFKRAMAWIEMWYGLHPKKKKHMNIISHIENDEKCAPPPLKNAPPLVKTNISRDKSLNRGVQGEIKINERVEKIGMISVYQKQVLSQYPEYLINLAIEDAVSYVQKGAKILKPFEYMVSRINKAMKRYRK